jgi:DNA polymerase-3 subunit delta'
VSEIPGRPRGHERVLARLEAFAGRASDGTLVEDQAVGGVPHALLFVGPAGVGKFQAALWWARRFKCDRQAECSPPCVVCKRIGAGSHPDVVVLTPEDGKAIGIDPVRELIRVMSLKRASSGPRIAILRDAHRLTLEAQSALLKLLEEPPGFALIVLVTENPAALLPTVRSRCQQLRFGAVALDETGAILVEHGFERGLSERAAALAFGSVGRALAMTPEVVADRDELIRAVETLHAAHPAETEQLVTALVERRKQDKAGLEEVLQWTLLRIEAACGAPPSPESPELAPILASTREEDVEPLLARAERVQWTLEALDRNANAKLAIRDLLLTLQGQRA